ncbi:dTDP-4-dehydrorhamnose 3,5-epimerase [Pseudoroseomonas wenyumeiae]|uniref:dTDP-4-dehydrorhamnose 3,5-epimerase n=1 Tax=Teichococcus wenyumeiae TaxID=2478470 RepID=A0A3A9JC43_9PROT|nr:dTDP-4-dehydrorhamnose 3,5-epimerase [Pseudoroseomonas wenyumeiae]RKK03041.1 dTDP-4-dehydrorhamnose 3,5-epimerase [Pseudoroseomonas wenyumeiae]RMI15535.1 dTDP-4-dehydrorhamnose 3,5-epimerase [Pseudoroseomonas wenyumeiae]
MPLTQSGNVSARRFEIEGPLLLQVRRFGDHRGFFMETYSQRDFEAVGVTDRFVQDNHSLSATPGTLRGMHFQLPPHAQAKLVRVLRGAVLDVIVDLRRASPSFGRHVAATLTAKGAEQLYVPAGFAHGFVTLEPDTEVAYKVTDYYAPECDRGLAWDDPDLALPWPELPDGPLLSAKDRVHPRLRDLPALF